MKLVIMTRPNCFTEEDKIITLLFRHGLEHLHLNKPNTQSIYLERLLTLIPKEFHKRITLYQHPDLLSEFDLAGFHSAGDIEAAPLMIKGVTCATCTDINQLKRYKKSFKYTILAHTLDYLQKQSAKLEDLNTYYKKGEIDKNVFASDHFHTKDIPIIKKIGFGGIIIKDLLWQKFDIHNDLNFGNILTQFEIIKSLTQNN